MPYNITMNLYIPTVGDTIVLTADWHFDLYNEDRNKTMMEFINDNRKMASRWGNRVDMYAIPAMVPAGETLKIDRIYIRKGQRKFDSITFLWAGNSIPAKTVTETNWQGTPFACRVPKKPIRFWVKLPCANKIEFTPVP